ncbi:MAG: cation:proton antiporter [Acidobacteriota bacterium]
MFASLLMGLQSQNRPLAILATLVIVLVIGTSAQILADRMRMPAVAPLLLAGIICGPSLLGLVVPGILGVGLQVIIRAAVAVCIFEGGLLLDLSAIRNTSRAVLGLVTVGLIITTILAGGAVKFFLDWPWEVCFLFGAIVSVTGPTVVTPILQRVAVNQRVRATLESESVIADPLGVILAALIFSAVTSAGGWSQALPLAVSSLASGLAIGASVAGVVWLSAGKLRLLPTKFARLAILGAALVAYTSAEVLFHESGVLAAAVAGIFIGSLPIPHKEQVEEFKGDLASISISAVFILLAASLQPSDLAALGWGGAAVILSIMVVVRPARVFLATAGSELRTNEKWFISLLGPRGVVAASIGTFFGFRMIDAGFPQGRGLEALVFGVVLATVIIEGSAAGWLARKFRVMPQHTIIVGADETARLLAADITAAGESVSIIDSDENECMLAKGIRGVTVLCADATDRAVLRKAGAENAKILIAATSSDKVNLLVCQNARAAFDVPRLVARTNSSSNLPAFEAADIETMSPSRAAAAILSNMVLRPSLFRLLASETSGQQLAEVRVSSPASAGKTLRDLSLADVVVVALRRGATMELPVGSTKLEKNDVLTLLGNEAGLTMARRRLAG